MSVYVDELVPTLKSKKWPYKEGCHLLADTDAELHHYALRLGLKRSWFQGNAALPHYDLTKGMRFQAIKKGALEISRKRVGKMIKEHRDQKRGFPA